MNVPVSCPEESVTPDRGFTIPEVAVKVTEAPARGVPRMKTWSCKVAGVPWVTTAADDVSVADTGTLSSVRLELEEESPLVEAVKTLEPDPLVLIAVRV